MKNIVMVGTDPGGCGGIQTFARYLSNIIPSLTYYTVYNGNYSGDEHKFALNRTLLNRVLNKVTNNKLSVIKLKKMLSVDDVDTVIINTPQDLKYIPDDIENILLVQHATFKRWWENEKFFNSKLSLLNEVKRRCQIVCLSEFEKEIISKEFCVDDKLVVIRNPSGISNIDLSYNNFDLVFCKKKLIMLSRFDNDVKCIDLVIESMANLCDYELHIYGDGKDRDYLVNIAAKYSNVFIHGWEKDIKRILANSGAIFVCSSSSEGYPMTAIEAMTNGMPLIVRDSFPSAKDIVKNNGFLIDSSWNVFDFINSVHLVESNYKGYSKASYIQAKRHTSDVLKNKWSDIC